MKIEQKIRGSPGAKTPMILSYSARLLVEGGKYSFKIIIFSCNGKQIDLYIYLYLFIYFKY